MGAYIVTTKVRVPCGPNDQRTAKTKLIADGVPVEFDTLGSALGFAAFLIAEGKWVSIESRVEQ